MDSIRELKIELKSTTGKSALLLSSVEGWRRETLPKLLLVFRLEKNKMAPLVRVDGTKSNARDIEAKIISQKSYLLTDQDLDLFVEWPKGIGIPGHEEIVQTDWKENPNFLQNIREICKRENRNSNRPIKLRAGKNNNLCRLEYICHSPSRLPDAPVELDSTINEIIQPIIGAEMKQWKDHSKRGGPIGFLSSEMLAWEDENGKSSGELVAIYPEGAPDRWPEFHQGRQDYWTGFALEIVLSEKSEGLKLTNTGNVGYDLTLENILIPKIAGRITRRKYFEEAKNFGKHNLLRALQHKYGVEFLASDVSGGSTVTREGLRRLARGIADKHGLPLTPSQISTKKNCIRWMLEAMGKRLEPDDYSPGRKGGGTITGYSLLKLWMGAKG